MNVFFSKLFRYQDRKSPDVLGLYPISVHINSIPERRYLWTARLMVIFGVFSICVTMMLALTLYLLLPQKGAMPSLYKVDKVSHHLIPTEPAEITKNYDPLVTEELIRRYIKLRHEVPHSYADLAYRWDKNSEFFQLSTMGTYQDFVYKMDNDAIMKLISKGVKREVKIDFVRQLTQDLWQARFRTFTSTRNNPEPDVIIWNAYLRILYVKIKDNPEEQEGVHSFDYTKNPHGFRVRGYSLSYAGTPIASDHYLDVAKQVLEIKNEENQ